MTSPSKRPPEHFFLATEGGRRFCIFHAPAASPRGAVLFLHPFAEEMNKSRRMAAQQSRALAAEGYAVLQIDLFGCGDSAGDLADATWSQWRADAQAGIAWLEARVPGPLTLWGLRLGAALAVDAARDRAPAALVLWQPVLDGATMLTQFLRLKVASQMLSEGRAEGGMKDLRSRLDAGETIEVAGYPIRRDLTSGIESVAAETLFASVSDATRIHWFEVVAQPDRPLPPAARRVVDGLAARGARIDATCVAGQPFWSTPEITECPALLAHTTAAMAGAAR